MHFYKFVLLPALVAAARLRTGTETNDHKNKKRAADGGGDRSAGVSIGDNPMDVIKVAHNQKKEETRQKMKTSCNEQEVPDDNCSWHAVQWALKFKEIEKKVQDKENNECKELAARLLEEGKQYVFPQLNAAMTAETCDEPLRRTAEAMLRWVQGKKETCKSLEIMHMDQCDDNEIEAKTAARAKLFQLCKEAKIKDKDCTGPKLAAKAAGQYEEARELKACTEAGLGAEHCSTANTVTLTKEEMEREKLREKHEGRNGPVSSDEGSEKDKGPGEPADPVTAATAPKHSDAAAVSCAAALALALAPRW